MKTLSLVLVSLILSSSSFASTLKCWKTDFNAAAPFMTAEIVSHNELKNIQFHYKNTNDNPAFTNIPGSLIGSLITSNRSPYKGNNQFKAPYFVLNLPTDLSNRNLEAVLPNGISRLYKNENGAMIYDANAGDSEGGSHLSARLRCSSDI